RSRATRSSSSIETSITRETPCCRSSATWIPTRHSRKFSVPTARFPRARRPGPNEEGVSGFRYRELSGDIGQTQIAFGWRTPGTTHPDTPALDLLAAVIGSGRASRLYRSVRERRLASGISAYNYTPTEIGVFVVHAETPPETTSDAA